MYLRRLVLPSEAAEDSFTTAEVRTCFPTFYPFHIFPEKQLRTILFARITLLYGGNGSGKSTLLQVLGQKLGAERHSDFNDAPFFDAFVERCYIEYEERPERSCVLTSDDVFDYVLRARSVNGNIDERRNELFETYMRIHREAQQRPDTVDRLRSLDDYDRWRMARDILSPRKTQSGFIKKHVARDIDLHSNGETSMRYFLDRIDEGDGVYLLDEPENSLSIEWQEQLATYIAATARATQSQFVIATHSPVLLSMPQAVIYDLDARPVAVRRWTELRNVRRYFDFFMAHKDEFDV